MLVKTIVCPLFTCTTLGTIIEGKVVAITAASSGIGEATALLRAIVVPSSCWAPVAPNVCGVSRNGSLVGTERRSIPVPTFGDLTTSHRWSSVARGSDVWRLNAYARSRSSTSDGVSNCGQTSTVPLLR